MSQRRALFIFIALVVFLFVQAVWWVVFMAKLVDEKVDVAEELGASPVYIEQIHNEEIQRQIMLGLEGTFFLILILIGIWLIYRSLIRADELKFHQQNFMMAVTHELKTPLASIKIYLDSLASPKIPVEKKEMLVPRMQQDIKRLEKLVENVLEAGRFDREGYHLNKDNFDLSRVVERSLDDLNDIPHANPLRIDRKIEPRIEINGDEAALKRAVDAILENCLKYSEAAEINIRVVLSKDTRYVRLTINDNGIGFSAAEGRELFERFFRAGSEMTRRTEGTGLGLYLSREIVRAHRGTITARSKGHGQGATFTIELPVE